MPIAGKWWMPVGSREELDEPGADRSETRIMSLLLLLNARVRGMSPTDAVEQRISESDNALPQVPVVVQAIVTTIGRTEHGSVIEVVGPAWLAVLEAISNDPNALFALSSREMEELVAASYDASGFDEVVLTPRSGDFGRDVIAIKRGHFSVRIIDQVKAYSHGHRVTANDVRALSGVLHADPAATKGIVTTTSTFAPGVHDDPSIAPLVPYRLELVDGAGLTERILSIRVANPRR